MSCFLFAIAEKKFPMEALARQGVAMEEITVPRDMQVEIIEVDLPLGAGGYNHGHNFG